MKLVSDTMAVDDEDDDIKSNVECKYIFLLFSLICMSISLKQAFQDQWLISFRLLTHPGVEYWMGLYKNEGTPISITYWLDGNPATYRHWGYEDPNSNSFCVRFATGGVWRDVECTNLYSCICKVSPT